jgi:hypothetical protein
MKWRGVIIKKPTYGDVIWSNLLNEKKVVSAT